MERFLSLGRQFLASFTAVFTSVILACTVFIAIFYTNPSLPLRLIAQAAIIAAASALLYFIFVSEKPIRRRSMAVRTVVHFLLQAATVAGCAWFFRWFSFSHGPSVLAFSLLFLAVYAVIWAACFVRDLADERNINRRLKVYLAERRAAPASGDDD